MDDKHDTTEIDISDFQRELATDRNSFRPIQKKPLSPDNQQFFSEVIDGLNRPQKTLPCKYFYDEKGSKLFEAICELEEYYVTRTELALLNQIKEELAELIGAEAGIIEPGAGAGIKIQTLFKALHSPHTYVPMDISKDFLFHSAQIIQQRFPEIEVFPIQGDFTLPVEWMGTKQKGKNVVFFPGSTIGNFEPQQAVQFLTNMSHLIGSDGAIIIGVDLMKDAEILKSAYDDSQGTTANFNKNLLSRINQQLDGNFVLKHFDHQAIVNFEQQRVEMHLVSNQTQRVTINGQTIPFKLGETIHTENSHKYTKQTFIDIAKQAGLTCDRTWIDDNNLFSIHYLTLA
jgi:dimethylhistidine N-methyltransferase